MNLREQNLLGAIWPEHFELTGLVSNSHRGYLATRRSLDAKRLVTGRASEVCVMRLVRLE